MSADCKKAEFHIDSEFTLTLHLADDFGSNGKVTKLDENILVAEFKDYGTRLEIEKSNESGLNFYKFSWYTPSTTKFLKDSIFLGELDTVQWFGGPQLLQQAWPILKSASGNKAQRDDSPFASFPRSDEKDAYLSYTICLPTGEIKFVDFHKSLFKLYLGHPKALIEKPIWTTWSRYGKSVTQEDVLKFKEEIISNKFPISQLELDDKWTTQYGDFVIDRVKFPDFKGMIASLHASGIRLTAWIHPFINVESETGKDIKYHEFFVKGINDLPTTIKWWDGEGYAVDFTNPKARNWFKENLQKLQKEGIYTYKFDAGEVAYLPKLFKLFEGNEPNDYSREYCKFAAEFGTAVENRVGSGTQNLAIMTRTIDRLSRWIDVGLQTVIPSTLLFSLQGYFWNLPDIIGGNGFELTDVGDRKNLRSDSELFVRWVQVNAFLLVMQFSFCPWDYKDSEKVVQICHKILSQRAPYIPYMKSEAKKAVETGIPLIRPIWWYIETKEAFLCDDQFFVGDRLLVAPVTREDTYKRTIILPDGHWKDDEGNEFHGPKTFEIDVPLERCPHFWKLNVEDSSAASNGGYCNLL
uniref:Family 31 glucosidase KIAA1161 n=1 Tax=Panagrolaimus sp. PS1159 TaxID=55785 RepID=A0AC35FPU2_9BILA